MTDRQGKDKEAIAEKRDELEEQLMKVTNKLVKNGEKHAGLQRDFNDLVERELEARETLLEARETIQVNAQSHMNEVRELQEHFDGNKILLEQELEIANGERERLTNLLQTADNEIDQLRKERDELSNENDQLKAKLDEA